MAAPTTNNVTLEEDILRNSPDNSWIDHSTVQPEPRTWNPFKRSVPQKLAPRDIDIVRQATYDLPLMMVSQPPGVSDIILNGYDYMAQAGAGVTIYIIDSGANLNHPVSI
jgi:hypothetical protein